MKFSNKEIKQFESLYVDYLRPKFLDGIDINRYLEWAQEGQSNQIENIENKYEIADRIVKDQRDKRTKQVFDYYINECYRIAEEHGFWDDKLVSIAKEIGDEIIPVFTFVANLIEQRRRGTKIHINESLIQNQLIRLKLLLIATELNEALHSEPSTIMEELVDVFIRLMDLVKYCEEMYYEDSVFVDVLNKKMEFNQTRSTLHGKRC